MNAPLTTGKCDGGAPDACWIARLTTIMNRISDTMIQAVRANLITISGMVCVMNLVVSGRLWLSMSRKPPRGGMPA